jgi:glycerophosphoryl diester phosphodiesterase
MRSKPQVTAPGLLKSNRPLLIAHRGYSRLAPENTLPAFRLALKAAADLVELDFHQTKDGRLVVIHDSILDRTTNARKLWRRKHIKVESITAAEIKRLDAGGWFARKYAHTRVPFLSEALAVIQKRAVALLERKSGDPVTCLEVIRNAKHLERTVVQSFDWAFLCQLHQLEPKLTLAALGPPSVLPNGKKARRVFRRFTTGWLKLAQKTGAEVIVWNKQISERAVGLTHSRGFKVWIYTIDHPKLARQLIRCGVDGLISNEARTRNLIAGSRHCPPS